MAHGKLMDRSAERPVEVCVKWRRRIAFNEFFRVVVYPQENNFDCLRAHGDAVPRPFSGIKEI